MGFNNWKKIMVAGVAIIAQGSFAAESQSNEQENQSKLVPVIYPGAKCISQDLKIPASIQDKGYRFLSNKDCTAYFVLPPEISAKKIEVNPIGSLTQCKAYKLAEGNQEIYEKKKRGLLIQSMDLQLEMMETNSESKESRLQKKIDKIDQQIAIIDKQKNNNIKDIYNTYGKIPGITYTVTLANQIDEKDLNELRRMNVEFRINDGYPGNNLPEYVQVPKKIMRADLHNSIYSFNFVSPENREEMDTILSSTFPGKVILEQIDAKNRVAHVKLDNVGSASMTLSLVGSCTGVKVLDDGQFAINKTDEPFVVNRSYTVDRQFTNGYWAEMNLESVKDQIVTETITHTNRGFRKDQAFEDIMTNSIDTAMTFEWTEEFNDGQSEYGLNEIIEVKQSVFAVFIDRIFEKLETEGKVRKVDPSQVTAAQGGVVTTNHVGHRCWTKKILFLKKRKCGNYTYQLTHWKNGITKKEISDYLALDFNISDSMKVNQSAPFNYSSTFEL